MAYGQEYIQDVRDSYFDDLDRRAEKFNKQKNSFSETKKMAYNNYNTYRPTGGYSKNPNSYQSQGFRGGNRSNYQGQNRSNGGAPKKHSGSKYKDSFFSRSTGARVDAPIITGWNYSRAKGLVSFIASPHKKKSKTSNPDIENWMVKLSHRMGVTWYLGFYKKSTGKLTIPDLQAVANPRAANGGYFGKYYRSK